MVDTVGSRTEDDQSYSFVEPKAVASCQPSRLGYRFIKRTFDIVFSLLVLVVLSWLLIIVAIAIRIESKGPIIYIRTCVGKGNRPFKMYKFRSMVSNADDLTSHFTDEQIAHYQKEVKIKSDTRITKVGEIIRKLSIDELPQFVSVIKGDMSVIGPRPMIDLDAEKFGNNLSKVLNAKPGVTGYWQVTGRNSCTYESGERQKRELYYAEHQSLSLDVWIFFQTIPAILRTKDAR